MQIATIRKPVLWAVVYLHGLNIVPGDVKTESVLLSSTSGVTMGDFGFSFQVSALS